MLSFLKNATDTNGRSDSKRRLWLILAVAAVGIALILLGSISSTAKEDTTPIEYRTEKDEIVIYQDYLETRIKQLCESVEGVGKVTVTVTLAGGFESVYATEWKDGNEEYVIVGSGSSATPVHLSRNAPEITGVGIVCSGGENEYVKYELIGLLSATLHINANRIYVAQAKG